MIKFFTKTSTLKLELARNGLTIQDFAKIINYNRDYINQVVNGRKNPSVKTASIIAKTLGCELEELFEIKQIEEVRN